MRAGLAQSCSYDTIGWGAVFKGSQAGLPAAAQWPSYFTADLVCSNNASCTCTSSPQVRSLPISGQHTQACNCHPLNISSTSRLGVSVQGLQAVTQPSSGTASSSASPQVSFQVSFGNITVAAAQPSRVISTSSETGRAAPWHACPDSLHAS